MALSSGSNNLFKLVGGWSLGLGLAALSIVHLDEIRSTLGIKLDAADFGVVTEAQKPEPEVREVIRYVERPADDREPRARQGQNARRAKAADEDLFKHAVQLRGDHYGHFHANAQINGRSINVLVDTGASLVAMSYEDAMAVGVSVRPDDFRYVSNTANGQTRIARVRLDEVRIGVITVRNVEASVHQPGKLNQTLLGNAFLNKVRYSVQGGMMVLEQ